MLQNNKKQNNSMKYNKKLPPLIDMKQKLDLGPEKCHLKEILCRKTCQSPFSATKKDIRYL